MKKLAGLRMGVIHLLAVAALVACSDSKNERRDTERGGTADLMAKFISLQSKAAAPANLPAGESVQIDDTGRLLYRNNLNKNCFISATGAIIHVQREEKDHLVTYKYYKASNTGEDAPCQANDAQCFAEVADCRKIALVIADNLLETFRAKIPLSFEDRAELMKLTPYRLKK